MLSNYCSSHRKTVLSILILLILLFRLSTLEILDLIDTTESRYAAVATHMLQNNDYVTPMIPKGADSVPYLGKPPFHFWLMVQTYKLFGVDEWTSRLPSFMSLLMIFCSYFLIGKKYSNPNLALTASAILSSSLLMFAISGAAMLDVTLTATVSMAIVSAFLFLQNKGQNFIYLFWLSLAIGVLVKGPAALVFTGLPLIGFVVYTKNIKSIFKLISPIGLILFFSMTTPWFYLSEKANPGFLRYFFFNENVLRYVTEEYGDLYGQGHVEPYGTALWMFALGFLPWTTIALGFLFSDKEKYGIRRFTLTPVGTLALFWMLVPLCFLAFIRQLHFGYVVPAMPGAALWLADMHAHSKQNDKHYMIINSVLLFFIFLCPYIAIGFGAEKIVILYSVLLFFLAIFIYKLKLGQIELISITSAIFYFLIYLTWSPIVSALRSTETAMQCISFIANEKMPEVAIVGDRSFSANWLRDAWQEELKEPFKLTFIPDRITVQSSADFVIQPKNEAPLNFNNLSNIIEISRFRVYSKNELPKINCDLPQLKDTECCRYNWESGNFFRNLKNALTKIIRQGSFLAQL